MSKQYNYLAIDTSESQCTVAVAVGNNNYYTQQELPRQHTKHIWSLINHTLAMAKIQLTTIDYLICGYGPGSFTGIRVACSVTQGIAVALNLPIIPVNTLECLAIDGAIKTQHKLIWPMLDAKMQGVYTGLYIVESNKTQIISQPKLVSYQDITTTKDHQQAYGIGSGWLIPSLSNLTQQIISTNSVSAAAILKAGINNRDKAIAVQQFQPLYLRNKIVNN